MSEKLIISISGMRGIVGENLTDSIVADYGSAFGSFLKKNKAQGKKLSVCIGRDSRPSGPMLESAVTAGLCAVGVDVISLGVVTTPGVGVMVKKLGCDGAVIITASHNPIQYNGVKLLFANGVAPPVEDAKKIQQHYFDRDFTFVDSPHCGQVSSESQTDAAHIAKVLQIVDKQKIAKSKYKVVIDSINGAGCRVTKKLLAELGCEVISVNGEPTGLFAHRPEPTKENLAGLCKIVKQGNPDIGFAQDPDADRLAIVDENGLYIGEEYTLALVCEYVLSKTKGSIATNLSTSRMVDDIAAKHNCTVIRTPVGEANVANAMLKNNCVIGGEGNGGVIDLRITPVRNSLLGIVLVLQLMAETGKTVSQLVAEIGGYYMSKEKFVAGGPQAEEIFHLAKKQFSDAKLNDSDGCRFDFTDGWLHLRNSNTEPVMRLIVEAKDKLAAQKYIDAVADIRKKVMG